MLNMVANWFNKGKSAEAKKTSGDIKKEVSDVEFATETSAEVSYVVEHLLKLHSYKDKNEFKKHVDLPYLASLKDKFLLLKNKLNKAEKANPSLKNLSIIKFCRSIAENDELHKELNNFAKRCHNIAISLDERKKPNNLAKKLHNVPRTTIHERLYPKLDKMVKNFDMHKLQKQISFLTKLEEKNDLSSLISEYDNPWDACNLLEDKDFQRYLSKTIVNEHIKLADQGEKAASKYFGDKVELQAYYTQINDTDRALNINIIGRDEDEPTQISDILQQEKNVSELNIYYKKKHEVRAYRDEKERRYYEFKDGAYYEMTSSWPVKDKSGNISVCTMIMNVSSTGITAILDFNGKKEVKLEEIRELVEQNHELYIQGRSLYDAVEKKLGLIPGESLRVIEKNRKKENSPVTMPDVIPIANRSAQEGEDIKVNQNPNDKGTNTMPDIIPIADRNAQEGGDIKVNQNPNNKGTNTITAADTSASKIIQPKQIAPTPQVAVGNTPSSIVSSVSTAQGIAPQTEFHLQQAETQTEVHSQQTSIETQTEVNLQQTEVAIQTEIPPQKTETKTQTEINSQQAETQTRIDSQQVDELSKSKQEESMKRESIKLKQEIEAGLQIMHQKHAELMQENQQLQKELEIAQAQSQLEYVELKKSKQGFEEEKWRLNQRVANAEQKIVELEQQNRDLQVEGVEVNQIIERLEGKNSSLQIANNEIRDKLAQLEKEKEEKAKEFESMHEEKEKIEKKLRDFSKENSGLKNEVEKSKKELNEAEEEAIHIVNKNNQQIHRVVEGLKSRVLELEQKNKEQLESSAKKSGEQLWKIKELQDELNVKSKALQDKKKIFEEAKRIYEMLEGKWKKLEEAYGELEKELDLEKMKNSMREGILGGQVEIRRGLENEIDELEEKVEELEGIIKQLEYTVENQERKNQDLTGQNKDSTKKIESLEREVDILGEEVYPLNPTDAQKVTGSKFREILDFTTGLGGLIAPFGNIKPKRPLSNSSSSDSGLSSGEEDNSPKSSRPRSTAASHSRGQGKTWSQIEKGECSPKNR